MTPAPAPPALSRRRLLVTAALGAVAVVAAFLGSRWPFGGSGGPGGSGSPDPGGAIGTVAGVRADGAAEFPLAGGGRGVLVALADGSIGCWDELCTHESCLCAWRGGPRLLECPCHGAAFDPEQGAAPVKGPATTPLRALEIRIDADGAIHLA